MMQNSQQSLEPGEGLKKRLARWRSDRHVQIGAASLAAAAVAAGTLAWYLRRRQRQKVDEQRAKSAASVLDLPRTHPVRAVKVKAVILDVDGTLIDSNDAHALAFTEAIILEGHAASFETIRDLIGMGSDKLLPKAVGIDAESKKGQAIGERKKQIFKEKYLEKLQPCRGARELVTALRDLGLNVVVASSAGEDELEALLKAAGVDDLIPDRVSGDDAEQSKPSPDTIEAALLKAGVPPEASIMIGDTPYDVEAARAAGVQIIGVRSGGWGQDDLEGAVAVYDDPAELLANFERHFDSVEPAED